MAEKKSFTDFKLPNTFVILFFLIVLATIGTYIVPAGVYDRITDPNTGRSVVDPATFHIVESSPVSPFDMFINIYKGLVQAADIIFFIMISYATFYLVLVSGALNAAIGSLLRATKGKDAFVIPLFVYLFATASTFFGMYEEAFGFIPIFVGLAIAMGYDAIVGMSVVAMGCGLGFAAAFMNPFTVGLAQKLAELPLFSGLAFRVVSWFVFVTMGALWTMRYAAKIRKDPDKSLMKGIDMGALAMDHNELIGTKFTGRNKSVLAVLLIGMCILIWGVLTKGWYFDELCGILLVTGVACGVANGYGPSRIAEIFIEAWKDILFGACIVGVSRGVLVVMQQGQIIDTVIYGMAAPLTLLPKWVAAEGMLFVQTLINFFIPSGSGQAATTIPIMAPLSDILGISRQIAVLAYQYGDGFSNILWPTTLLPVMCGIAKVPIEKWWKYFVPFFFMLFAVQMVFIFVAVMINYQ
ncbi:MAG: TIGR00366 family protein [bacterium]|nr:TIGR00366 family protein [bacterium]